MNMMKHRFPALLLSLACIAGVAADVFAQDYTPVPVTISRSQVSMNGKTYYAHIVLERQTIYGITRHTVSPKRTSMPPTRCWPRKD